MSDISYGVSTHRGISQSIWQATKNGLSHFGDSRVSGTHSQRRRRLNGTCRLTRHIPARLRKTCVIIYKCTHIQNYITNERNVIEFGKQRINCSYSFYLHVNVSSTTHTSKYPTTPVCISSDILYVYENILYVYEKRHIKTYSFKDAGCEKIFKMKFI